MAGELLRVSNVSVRGLFGIYDHEFSLNSEERITILHGPNGVGKTILLKCISAFFNGHYSMLRKTPFKTFSVTLSDGSRISILREIIESNASKTRRTIREQQTIELTAEIRIGGSKQTISIKPSADMGQLAKMIEQNSPYIMQAGENLWIDQRSDRVYTSEELVESNLEFVSAGRLGRMREAEPEALQAFRKLVKVSLIETERLVSASSDEGPYSSGRQRQPFSSVNNYAKQLQKRIEASLAQYGRSAQQLDQSFPQRLIQEHIEELELGELKRRMEQLEVRQQALSEIGLLDKVPTRPFDPDSLDDVDQAKLGPMTLYLLDSEKKISAFDEIAERLKLLVDSARSRFKNKTLSISRERGMQVTGANNEVLELDGLSSGEQHEIVLMYELLFKTPSNSLIMIDEPELSLHVSWQRLFLPELLSAAKTVGFDVVLATHSPFIVGGRTDLMTGLDMDRDDMPDVSPIGSVEEGLA